MLMVVAILIPNKQVAVQFQTILQRFTNFNSGGTSKELPIHCNGNGSGTPNF